jgi:hypothetical protein
MFVLGMAHPTVARDDAGQQPSARQQHQPIHTPQSIDQELAHLTKDLELTSDQQKQVRPLLEGHRDRIQALLDKNPTASRQEPDSRYQRRNAPQDSYAAYGSPERIGKVDAATRAQW